MKKQTLKKGTVFLFVLVLSIISAHASDTLIYSPQKDTYVYKNVWEPNGDGATTNYGTLDKLSLLDEGTNPKIFNKTMMSFSIDTLVNDANLIEAYLYLYHNETGLGHATPNAFRIFCYTSNWEENTITWNNAPAITSDVNVYVPESTSETMDYVIDVTSLIRYQVGINQSNGVFNGEVAFEMLLYGSDNSLQRVEWASKEHANAALHPKLKLIVDKDANIKPDEGSINLNIEPVKDAYIYNKEKYPERADLNYGTLDYVKLLDSEWSARDYIQSVLAFNINDTVFQNLDVFDVKNQLVFARLNLYFDGSTDKYTGDNAFDIYSYTTDWKEDEITWNNAPAITNDTLLVQVRKSPYNSANYSIDITDFLKTQLDSGRNTQDFGFRLKLRNGTSGTSQSLRWASKEHVNQELHPKLELYFKPIQNQKLEPEKDAFIYSKEAYPERADLNYGTSPNLILDDSKWSARDYRQTVMSFSTQSSEFDEFFKSYLGDLLDTAYLYLYYGEGSNLDQEGNNDFRIYCYTDNWTEDLITWNNAPQVTNDSVYVGVPLSTFSDQDYKIDVTNLVLEQYKNNLIDGKFSGSISFRIQLRYGARGSTQFVIWASKEHENAEIHPKLEFILKSAMDPTSLGKTLTLDNENISIYPNPANEWFKINLPKNISNGNVQIYNMNGSCVYETDHYTNQQIRLDKIGKGIYIIVVNDGEKRYLAKLIKQ